MFPHFGRTPQFKINEVEDGKVKTLQVIDTRETEHGGCH
ncbi:NifB/NifX family molybdenum-iron cluster-binding protein [uncultured Eubacterium sp.]|nr:NifB/NifX family molybdenum-iron cluster-binding protein [uncultured Eubacterium sp.]